MAEQPESAADALDRKPKSKLPKKLMMVVGAVAVLQGVGFFVFFKFMGSGPEAAHGAGNPAIEAPAEAANVPSVEVSLLKSFKAPNDFGGVMCIYDCDLSVVVPEDCKAEMEKLVETRQGEIADRVSRIIRGADDRMLREPDLRVLRGQFTTALQEIVGDEKLIQRVLIPKLVPIRAD